MDVMVNGEPRQLDPGTTVEALVEQITSTGGSIAVAVGNEVVTRSRWAGTELYDGAQVEILTPRQGG